MPQRHKASNVCVPPAEPPDLLDFWPPEGSSVRNTAALCPSATPPHSLTLLAGAAQCTLFIFFFFLGGGVGVVLQNVTLALRVCVCVFFVRHIYIYSRTILQ